MDVTVTLLEDRLFLGKLRRYNRGVISFIGTGSRSRLLESEVLPQLGSQALLGAECVRVHLLLLIESSVLHGEIGAALIESLNVLVEVKLRADFVLSRACNY